VPCAVRQCAVVHAKRSCMHAACLVTSMLQWVMIGPGWLGGRLGGLWALLREHWVVVFVHDPIVDELCAGALCQSCLSASSVARSLQVALTGKESTTMLFAPFRTSPHIAHSQERLLPYRALYECQSGTRTFAAQWLPPPTHTHLCGSAVMLVMMPSLHSTPLQVSRNSSDVVLSEAAAALAAAASDGPSTLRVSGAGTLGSLMCIPGGE
jgi:hypothetical protein